MNAKDAASGEKESLHSCAAGQFCETLRGLAAIAIATITRVSGVHVLYMLQQY